MKYVTLLHFVLVLDFSLYGQAFSDKTNAIRLNNQTPTIATTLPTITWIVPKAEVSNSIESSVVFEAEINSEVALKNVTLEFTVGGEKYQKVVDVAPNEMQKTIKQKFNLLDGESVFKLIVENVKGGMVSSTRSILSGRDAVAEAVDINRKDYALIFAIDQYEQFDELVNPVNDARTIDALLREKYGFQTEIVENATTDQILSKITDYNEKRFNPQDQLFVFFAGHGTFDATLGEGYVVARNSVANEKGRGSYVSHVLLRSRLENIKCEHIFLMMDVCFGGTIDPVLARARATEDMDETADKQYLVKKLTKRTRKFLTSGSKEYVSDGIPGKHSPFAEKFILALKEIGGGSGRILSLIELQPYFLRLASESRFGSFGSDDPASDFVFVAKQGR